MEAKALTNVYTKGLIQDMIDTAPNRTKNVKSIGIVSSMLSNKCANMESIKNSIVRGRNELLSYHGPLSNCASTVVRININSACQTVLESVLKCSAKVAKSIVNHRKVNPFTNFSDVKRFITAEHGESIDINSWRNVLFLVDDDTLDDEEEEE